MIIDVCGALSGQVEVGVVGEVDGCSPARLGLVEQGERVPL